MKQRWALVAMGAWLAGTVCMSIVATENSYTIDHAAYTSLEMLKLVVGIVITWWIAKSFPVSEAANHTART